MGSSNLGNQIITVKYYAPATTAVVDRRNVDIEAVGVYKGGLLTRINDTTVEVGTMVVEIRDTSSQVRVETQSAVNITLTSATPYIVARWTYVAAVANYLDLLAVAYGSIQDNDIILGKCTYAGSVMTGIDYGLRTITMKLKEFLKVEPTSPASMKVHVKGGITSYGARKLQIAEQDSPFTITAPSVNPRIDYVYISEAGVVSVETGAEAASPVVKDYQSRIVLAEIYLIVGQTSIIADDITDVRSFVGGGSGSGTSVSVRVSQSTHSFAVGDVLRYNAGTSRYVKAQADSEANARVVGIVSSVTDADNFVMTQLGLVTGLSGLTAGLQYYLSDSVAGALTATEPVTVGLVSKPQLIALSTTSGYFFNFRGNVIASSGAGSAGGYTTTFDNGDLIAGVITFTHGLASSSIGGVSLINDLGIEYKPDYWKVIDSGNVEVGITSYGVISGTHTGVVIAKV